MTQKELDDFKLYGCASACLIRLLEERDKPTSREDFVALHTSKFQFGQCGRLTVDKICEIVMGWEIFGGVYSMRDATLVKKKFVDSADADILVLTDKTLDQKTGLYTPVFHCSLAIGWRGVQGCEIPTTDEILLFYPYQDDSSEEKWLSLAELDRRLVHFLLLS